MSTIERGFTEFRPGDNPYELGGGAVPKLAEMSGSELSAEPNPAEIQEHLFSKWGKEKEFIANVAGFEASLTPGEDVQGRVAELIDQSGITKGFAPRRVDGENGERKFKSAVIGAGVGNWMFRRANLATKLAEQEYTYDQIVLLGGARPMTTPNELKTYFVQHWLTEHDGNAPTESDYLHTVVAPLLGQLSANIVEQLRP